MSVYLWLVGIVPFWVFYVDNWFGEQRLGRALIVAIVWPLAVPLTVCVVIHREAFRR